MSLSGPFFSGENLNRRLFFFILILCLFTRLILITRPVPYLDGKLLPDDTYLSLQIAKNIANGKGPLYGDQFTNGFQPLYVFVVAPLFKLTSDQIFAPIKMALCILTLFDVATLAILLIWVMSLTKNNLIVCIVGIFWIFNDYIIRTSLNGLETIMASFFIVSASYLFYRIYWTLPERKVSHFFSLGIITGFACFTRVDSGLFALIIGLMILLFEYKDFKKMFFRASLFSIGVLLIFSIWIVYSMYYNKSWYPESGEAVRFMSTAFIDHNVTWKWYLEMLHIAIISQLSGNGILLILIGFLSIIGLRKKYLTLDLFKFITPLLLFCIAIFLAYTFYIFTSWYFQRYLFPFSPMLLLLFAILFNATINSFSGRYTRGFFLGTLVIWFIPLLVRGKYLDYFIGDVNKNLGYMNLGLWAEENLPEKTVVGSSQSGALSYFAPSLNVVNLDGVVNTKCFESLVQNRNMDFIKEQKIDYVFGWPVNIKFIELHSKNFKPEDLILIKKIEEFKSWDTEWSLFKVNR